MRSPYETLADSIERSAQQWPSAHPTLQQRLDIQPARFPTHRPYIDIVPILLAEARETAPSTPHRELARSHGVAHGLSVAARFYCHAFQSAVHHGMPLDTATDQLRDLPPQHNPLHQIAQYPNRIALVYEDTLGVVKDSFCTFDARWATAYRWQDGVFTPSSAIKESLSAELADLRQRSEHELITERSGNPVNLEGKCPAERAGQLARITQAILTICSKDTSLAHRTYDLSITNCRPNG